LVDAAGFQAIDFALLSGYDYPTDEQQRPLAVAAIPKGVAKLDGCDVTIAGFMVPLAFAEDRVTTFVLVPNQLLCCYGQQPRINEWIYVRADPPQAAIRDVPVAIFGRMTVAPEVQDGRVLCLYRMTCRRLETLEP
jgi:hypothetical protein